MQLLVFFTLLFRTPYILYIFWIIYISSYTKVHIFFHWGHTMEFYNFTVNGAAHNGLKSNLKEYSYLYIFTCYFCKIFTGDLIWDWFTFLSTKPKDDRRLFGKLYMNCTAVIHLWLTFMNFAFSCIFLNCLHRYIFNVFVPSFKSTSDQIKT